MREIKFRAWDKKEGKIDYDPGVKRSEDWLSPDINSLIEHCQEEEDCILMQYTGLKDKNGVEIYEGDIALIKHSYKNRTWQGEVIWERWRFTGKGFFFPHFDAPYDLFCEGAQYIEVIGNVYENPELLK